MSHNGVQPMQQTLETQRSIARAPNGTAFKKVVSLRKPVDSFQDGERLTQKEFHRRYEKMSEDYCAELIGGIVHVTAAAHHPHSRPLSLIHGLLSRYEAATPGVESGIDITTVLDSETEVQPDTSLAVSPAYGGKGSDADRYYKHAPELVVEVSHTTEHIDLNEKFRAYEKNNTLEYLVHLVREPAVKWFVLKNGAYELLPCDKAGVIRSETFPGLWLNTRALIKRDLRAMVKTLEKGLASPEHAAFCKRLRSTAARIRAGKNQ